MEIALSSNGIRGYHTTGFVDGIGVDFAVDTGADTVQIPKRIAAELYHEARLTDADVKGWARMGSANGTVSKELIVRLDSITIGGHTVRNVVATIALNDTMPALLGQTFLRHFASYTIDNSRHMLVLGPPVG